MIAEEIAKAKQAKQKRLLTGLILVVILAVVAIGLLYGFSNFKLISQQENAEDESQVTPEKAKPSKAETEQQNVNNAELRQAYLEAFAHFENNLKPQLANIDIANWDPPLADKLALQQEKAISAFGAGQYANAKNAIDTLITTAEKTITDSQSAFEQAMQQAQSAYENNDYPNARLAIDTALLLDSSSEQAPTLASQIELIPQIADLNEAIRVAKIENNAAKELKLIQQLLAIAPEREAMQQRANILRTQLANAQFNQHISHAYRAIDNRQAAEAKKALALAQKVYPSRSEVADAKNKVASLESQLRFETHSEKALVAEKADDWITAKQQLELALKEKPADKTLSNKLADADRIVSLMKTFKRLLATPYRLANKQVKTEADISLIQSQSYTSKSPSLANMTRQLESTIKAVNTPVNVTVLSDGNTNISVRGVGIVGTTTSKMIELKPGPYTFEGKRKGYKSKLVEIMIPIDKPTYQLRVVADERI